jgi:hypothetical protein
MSRARFVVLALLAAGCTLSAPSRWQEGPLPEGASWVYDVRVADDLAHIDVTMTIRGAPPESLVLGDARGGAHLRSVSAAWTGGSKALENQDGEFALDGVGDGAVVTWRADMDAMTEGGLSMRVGRSLCASPGLWLLRPRRIRDGTEASLSLRLSEGDEASLPWQRQPDGTYRLPDTAFFWRGFAAFGTLGKHAVEVPGGRLDVAVLDRRTAASWPVLERWLVRAARAQGTLWGGFPVPRAQVILRPVSSASAVPFGETLRGGGPAVILLVGDEAIDRLFADDWVAVHEFAHLGVPAIAPEDAWMSEGFIQYYTEVLMGRDGLLDEQGAWQEIVSGFARGRADGTGAPLSAESAGMARSHSYLRVYWAGAAIALLADVELRRGSGGTRSLDDAMREVGRAFKGRNDGVPASEIVAHLDRWLGRPLFSDLASAHLASPEFPDVTATLARLGVVVEDGRVTRFDETAPDAAVRRAIVERAIVERAR